MYLNRITVRFVFKKNRTTEDKHICFYNNLLMDLKEEKLTNTMTNFILLSSF